MEKQNTGTGTGLTPRAFPEFNVMYRINRTQSHPLTFACLPYDQTCARNDFEVTFLGAFVGIRDIMAYM